MKFKKTDFNGADSFQQENSFCAYAPKLLQTLSLKAF